MIGSDLRLDEWVEAWPCKQTPKLRQIVMDFLPALSFWPASKSFHHWWVGGLEDHLSQMLAFMAGNIEFYQCEKIPQGEIFAAVLFHDWSKLWRYKLKEMQMIMSHHPFENDDNFKDTVEPGLRQGAWIHSIFDNPSEDLLNALSMAEGGWSPLAQVPGHEMTPLATLLHAADMYSSKVLKTQNNVSCKRWSRLPRPDLSVEYMKLQEAAFPLKERARWPGR